VKLASQRKKLTVFFSDIAGFTETAERLESEDLIWLLNHYLTGAGNASTDHAPKGALPGHPRGCGERDPDYTAGALGGGSSPRVRGTRPST
jgi:hypothetical protein